jgi:hypothetical protein
MNYVLETAVPNLETFINALTGKGSLTAATEDGTAGAFKFGEQVRKVIKTVISLKDELLIVGGVLAGLFVVSKISAAVMGTIALIKTVITAYNALKASAIIAGVAAYFALNPLAGVAAVAIAAGVLAGASRLIGSSDVDTSGLGVSGVGGFSGTMPNGQPFVSGSTARTGGAGTTTPTIVVPSTGGVSTASRVAATAAAASTNVVAGSFDVGRFRMAEERDNGTTINLTVTGAFDKEGTARTIVNTLNDSFYRGTGGAGSLQIA